MSSGGDVPQIIFSITPADECASVRRVRDRIDIIRMPFKGLLVFARGGIPQPDVRSPLPLASVLPSGEYVTTLIQRVCSSRVCLCLSGDSIPQSNGFVPTPTCECATIWRICNRIDSIRMPFKGLLVLPVVVSHNRIVSSWLPLASVSPTGEYAIVPTQPVCPSRVCLC